MKCVSRDGVEQHLFIVLLIFFMLCFVDPV